MDSNTPAPPYSNDRDISAENQVTKVTLIDKLREEYENTMSIIDNYVPKLIKQGQEMKGLLTLYNNVGKILEIHEALSNLYSIILGSIDVLKQHGSKRLKQLGHSPILTFEYLKNHNDLGASDEVLESIVIDDIKKQGIIKSHWYIKGRFLAETEYMLDTLKILIEPEFVPLETSVQQAEDSKEIAERYIPSSVKISVWRRDQGKCVQCGLNEKLEYDHIIPVAKGGSNTERNVQLLCEKCNREKHAKII